MPITVQHSPDPSLLASMGYFAGAGQQAQWAQEMQQRERMQQRQMQFQMMDRALARQDAWQARGAAFAERNILAQQGFDNRRLLQQEDHEHWNRRQEQQDKLRLNIEEMRRQADHDQMIQEHERRKELAELSAMNGMARDQAAYMYSQSDGIRDHINRMRQHGYTYSEEDSARAAAIEDSIANITQARNKAGSLLTPTQKAEALYKLSNELLSIPLSKPPTTEDLIQDKISVFEDPYGRRWPTTLDSNGVPQIVGGYKPYEEENVQRTQVPANETERRQMAVDRVARMEPSEMQAWWKIASDDLTAQFATRTYPSDHEDKSKAGQLKPPSTEEIWERVYEMLVPPSPGGGSLTPPSKVPNKGGPAGAPAEEKPQQPRPLPANFIPRDPAKIPQDHVYEFEIPDATGYHPGVAAPPAAGY